MGGRKWSVQPLNYCVSTELTHPSQIVSKFVNDPSVVVFLLHSRSQSAGLNLTCASTVMMLEPLLHPALELQAFGRIHRIGQKKEVSCIWREGEAERG